MANAPRGAVTSLLMLPLFMVPAHALRGQDGGRGSRNAPVDHWAYEHIQRLRSRGYLANLNPLVQPYRRADVARALTDVDPDTLGSPMADWVRLLQDEFRPELQRIAGQETRSWGLQLIAETRASTSRRLDPVRATGEKGAWPRPAGAVWVELGPLAAETRLERDEYLPDDPDGLEQGQGTIGRTDNAYLSVTFPIGNVTFGRLKRNWSVLGSAGLMVSGEPRAYPQLAFEARGSRFSLRSLTGELETLVGPTMTGPGPTVTGPTEQKRYLSAHRLDYATDNLVVSFGEAVLYATPFGLSLRFLNPFEFLFANRSDEPKDVTENVMLDFQVWHRWRGLELYVQGMIDDLDLNPPDTVDRAPTRYGFFVLVRAPSLARRVEFEVSYRQVGAFTYRTNRFVDKYTFLERSLGDNFADYDRLTAALSLFPAVRGLRVTPTFVVQRQGEGGPRQPFPADYTDFRASPSLFIGQAETTYRLALAGRFQPNRFLWMTWDVGENFLRDAGHVPGVNATDFAAVGAAGLMFDLPF